jgi:circadian clock protein KaiC
MTDGHAARPTRDGAQKPVVIRKLASGVPGFDEVLGGGIPEYSFNMIAGAPGTGKTTLAEQIMFANATEERPALHFTVLGEPPLKMLRYQQQFEFFDLSRVGTAVRFLNLSDEVLQRDLSTVFDRIVREVDDAKPGIVVVDSFRTVIRNSEVGARELDLQHFVQRLALRLTSWEATTFLLGEYGESESRSPVFTVADGVFWLSNDVERNATVRRLRVTKIRGQAPLPGLHTVRIADAGVEVFPRQLRSRVGPVRTDTGTRLSIGVAELDAMMGGGIPAGDSVLVSGPTGAGKTILGTQFIAAGVAAGESGVIAVFEEHPEAYISRARNLGFDLRDMMDRGKLDVVYLRPLDLSVDETLREIEDRVHRIGAKRVVIDSLSGFEIALAPGFREDFRESYYRLLQSLTQSSITVVSMIETSGENDYLRFSPYSVSFLSDDILAMRYIELEGRLRTVLSVIKMRGSDHSRELRIAEVTGHGMEIRQALSGYRGIITGVPAPRWDGDAAPGLELTPEEAQVLDVLLARGAHSADALTAATGLTLDLVMRVLDALAAAQYVIASDGDEPKAYRVAARVLGRTVQPQGDEKRPL